MALLGCDDKRGDTAADLLVHCAAILEGSTPSAPLVQAVSKLVLAALRPNVTLADAASKGAFRLEVEHSAKICATD